MKPFINAMKTGLAEIRVHKMRSVLSFLAIAVGSVVFIDAFASIFATYDRLQKQKEVSGMARLRITQATGQSYSSPDDYVPIPNIAYADVVSLREKLPGLYMVSPEGCRWRNVFEYNGRRVVSSVCGVTPEWKKRDFIYTLKGRFLDWNDVDKQLRVCVIVKKAVPPPANSFYKTRRKQWDITNAFDVMVSHNDLLGQLVKIDGVALTVIGVLEELPPSKRPDIIQRSGRDYKILIPATTLERYFLRFAQSLEVSIDAGSEDAFAESMKLINNFLKIRFGDEEYFLVENQMDLIKEKIASAMKDSLMAISLGMLAFLAGGIGIMNVTLATVFARTKEIGIRRAVGASRGDIMLQFIVEAVMLGLIGGVLGSALGYLWGVPVKVMLGMGASPIKPWMPVVSVFIAAFTAFVFAIYPAWVAASMKPADALRTE